MICASTAAPFLTAPLLTSPSCRLACGAQLEAEAHATRVRNARIGASHTTAMEAAAAKQRQREAAAAELVRDHQYIRIHAQYEKPPCAPLSHAHTLEWHRLLRRA